ncbi:MAG: tetratricopeptide repeat protein [Candidatus Acidiferrales bacterium]
MTRKRFPGLLVVLLFTAVYEYAWPTPTLHFYAFVLLHLVAGIAFLALLFFLFGRIWRDSRIIDRAAWSFLALGGCIGVALIFTGTLRNDFPMLGAHIIASILGVILLLGSWLRRQRFFSGAIPGAACWTVIVVLFAAVSYGAWCLRTTRRQVSYKIENPKIAPATMNDEGGGSAGPFFPASVEVANNARIPNEFFMESETCRQCHADIYRQWEGSAHHFSSFNNQWYRKSIEYMQDTVGIRPSKWCAGCHDPALLLTGMFDRPVREVENTPEGQAGLGCVMCHSIVAVQSTMGQNNYVLEYPPLNDLATSKNSVVHHLVDFLLKLDPEPHRRVFMKPFVKNQTAEFCSSCHKVHLDFPVNHYRWTRGFNEYDNWQASGVSGEGARSFYYPPHPQTCTDCHMPAVHSGDFGNYAGVIHSHRFPAANTALPYENEDAQQLDAVEKFLEDNQVSVDIFGLSPEQSKPSEANPSPAGASVGAMQQIQTTFGVGEEAPFQAPVGQQGLATPASRLTAPFGRFPVQVRRGDTERVDVVVRTRSVGHFFPGGTVDAFDLWLELHATDENGRSLFWSGEAGANDDGDGPVDPAAQFYRSLLIDAHGNPINKRNAWAERAVIYVRLIPPGAADTIHYRLYIPKDAGNRITLTAKLNYRKFSWWFTQFSFAGMQDPSQHSPAVSPAYDDTKWTFTGNTKNDSGKRPGIPNAPIVVMAQSKAELQVLPADASFPKPKIDVEGADWQRWNDYGIGLLLQGDLQGAESAFENVAQAAPTRGDGWVNMARVRLQEGNLSGAEQVLTQCLEVAPTLASAHFFYATLLRDRGQYDSAIAQLRIALEQYPNDRVARNDLGRTLFLERRYPEAIREFQTVLQIDPEDVEANYSLMLCYNGLGQPSRAHDYELRYLRFKANEAEDSLTGPYLRSHPNENNERQPIHEIESAPLQPPSPGGDPPRSRGSRP